MQIIKIRAKFAKEIVDALAAELTKGIPEEDKAALHEMAETCGEIKNRADDAKAIPSKLVEKFNSLCYKLFPEEQDGEEFTKEEAQKMEKRHGGIPTVCDEKALDLVHNYILDHLDKSDPEIPDFSVFIVWKAKILQNWKRLLSSTLLDGMYYELTYNGDKEEYYLDAYRKVENKVIRRGGYLNESDCL